MSEALGTSGGGVSLSFHKIREVGEFWVIGLQCAAGKCGFHSEMAGNLWNGSNVQVT